MFHYSEEDGAYLAELDELEFICEEPSEECEAQAKALAVCYEERLPDLAAFMLEEMDGVLGPLTAEELTAHLGKPQIDLDRSCVTYLEQDLDDHILEVEFEGELEEFLYFTMDG